MEDKKKGGSFIKQAAILAAAGMIVRFIGFLYRVPMTAVLGDTGNAIYSAGYQVYNFLLILSSAGLPAAIGKMVSERLALKEYKNAHNVFKVSLMFSVCMGTLLMVFLIIFANPVAKYICKIPDAYYTLISLAPTILIVAVMSVLRGYFQGHNNMVPTAFSQIIEQVFNAVFSVFLAYLLIKHSIALSAAGGTAATGIGAFAGLIVMTIVYFRKRSSIIEKVNKDNVLYRIESKKEILKTLILTAVPIIIGTAIYSITNLFDMSMVMGRLLYSGAFAEAEATILYGQLQGKYVVITTLPVAISTSIATASVPSIASSVALKDKDTVERKINAAIKISMIISIPAAIGVGVLAKQILMLLFPTVPEGASLLRVGSVSIIFLALSQIVTGTLQGIGKVSVPAKNAFWGAIVKILFNYILIAIPFFNINGAIIATTLCYITASLLNLRALIKTTGIKFKFIDIMLKPLIASLIMGIVCFMLYKGSYIVTSNNTISTVFSVLISMGVYFAIMLFIKGIVKEDIQMLPGGKKLSAICEKLSLI